MGQNAENSPSRAANIFINYRREDSAGHAGRLFDRLRARFPGRVFMDIDTIEPGADFVDVIEQAVGKCEVLIVVIGREWLSIKDATGRRRLDNPEDFVRLEVASALERNIRVIPVLVEDASMPRLEDLPPDLAKLARRNAIELSDGRWAFDVDRLLQTIEGVLQEKAPSAPVPGPSDRGQRVPARETVIPGAWIALAALVLLALTGGIGWSLVKRETPQEQVAQMVESVPLTTAGPEEQPPGPTVPEEQPEEIAPGGSPMGQEANGPQAENDSALAEQQPAYGPDTCKRGFVWREARPMDHVCVTPETRRQTVEDNLQAEARRDPAGGAYGLDTCLPGYVWRAAFEDDRVCVTPETRDQVLSDNSKASERRMRPVVRWTKSLLKSRKPEQASQQ
ncbi:MAG TPA: toll/interleukin-1 receptor domain-containing protein [Thermoanaerobaculia bacterium]|nr:toll/interleukin-1 receptor domain-containing protein [Thermoanaerobaculia bacterium]